MPSFHRSFVLAHDTLCLGTSPLEVITLGVFVPCRHPLLIPRCGGCHSGLRPNQCKVVRTALQTATFYQLACALGTCDTLQSEPIIPRIQHPACYIGRFDIIVQEGIGQKLCIKYGVIGWSEKYEVSNASDLVSVRGWLAPRSCDPYSQWRTFDRSGNAP